MLRKQALNHVTLTVPKNRKPKFDLTLHIIDLTNIPLIYGTAQVKWNLSSSAAAEHRGGTDRTSIVEHKAIWNYHKEISVRLTIDKTGMLQECNLSFEVLQDFPGGGRGGRVVLGKRTLNLAEYARLPEEALADHGPDMEGAEGGITRRYLLQDSKVNSTLKVGIKMKQTEGDTNFIAPPLKSAMVIGGIAGVLSTEVGEGDDIPSITSKTRELTEAQDIYRRTLAATWACHAGELAPDKLIEDLFAGGDGGRVRPPSRPGLGAAHEAHEEGMNSSSSEEPRRATTPRPHLTPQMPTVRRDHRRAGSADSPNPHAAIAAAVSGRSSIEQQMQQAVQHGHNRRRDRKEYIEPSEFDLREDLRSWSVRVQ